MYLVNTERGLRVIKCYSRYAHGFSHMGSSISPKYGQTKLTLGVTMSMNDCVMSVKYVMVVCWFRKWMDVIVTVPCKSFKWHPTHLPHAGWGLKFLQEKHNNIKHLCKLLIGSHLMQSPSFILPFLVPSRVLKHPYNQIIAILYLYNAENVIVAQMLSLTVDQKVI